MVKKQDITLITAIDKLATEGKFLKYWDISLPPDGKIFKEITAKFINGYVPVYSKEDQTEKAMSRLFHGNKTKETKNELIKLIREGAPKVFNHLAKMALNEIPDEENKFCGIEGLHIGSGNMEMKIGGTDSPVIKHPHTLEPYIPGSSLKGKIRSLLEMESGLMIYTNPIGNVVSGETWKNPAVTGNPELKDKCEAILKIFGSSGADKEDETQFGPTRVSFADCYLEGSWRDKAKGNRWLLTEEKSENVINRVKGTAEHPRFIERVPEGARFTFRITFKVLESGDDKLFDEVLLKGLKLLEMDTLGGNGSRGYGRIAFEFTNEAMREKFAELKPFS